MKELLQLISVKLRKGMQRIDLDDITFDEEHPSIGILDFHYNCDEMKWLFTDKAWNTVIAASK